MVDIDGHGNEESVQMCVAGATAQVNDCAGGKPSNLDSPKKTSISVSLAFLSSLSYFHSCSSRCG